jgi:hypothetical protein
MKKRLLLLMITLLPVVAATAQCVICTKTAAELDEGSARGLNGGIIYLAFFPLVLLGTIGYIWWRRMRGTSGHQGGNSI